MDGNIMCTTDIVGEVIMLDRTVVGGGCSCVGGGKLQACPHFVHETLP